jgi:signal transduction histidine kinase
MFDRGFEAMEALTVDLARFREESSPGAWDALLLHGVAQLVKLPISLVCRVDQETSDFVISCVEPQGEETGAEQLLARAIESGTFAWALRQNRLTEHRVGEQVWWMYPLVSRRQVWGMWMGIADESSGHEPLLRILGLMMAQWLNAWENEQLRHEVVRDRTVLERLVEERTRDLRTALDAAETANRAKGLFLANISHELRTPLNGILGMAELLGTEELDASMRERVDSIRSCGERLLQVIENVLEMTQIESGRLSYDRRSFALYSLVEQVVERYRHSADAKGLDLVLQWGPEVPLRAENDPDRLEQILDSLLENAVKFTERGVVSVSVEVALFDLDQVRLRFRIEDSGIGIKSPDVAQLFKPFIQVDPSTTRRYGGLGLGLAISRTLARGMGGDIYFEPASVRGSVFILELPFDHPMSADAVTSPALTSRWARDVKIWVVDPMPPTRNAVTLQLRRLGFTVTAMCSLHDAPAWEPGTAIVIEAASFEAELPILRSLPRPEPGRPGLLVVLGAMPTAERDSGLAVEAWEMKTLLRPVRSDTWRELFQNAACGEIADFARDF